MRAPNFQQTLQRIINHCSYSYSSSQANPSYEENDEWEALLADLESAILELGDGTASEPIHIASFLTALSASRLGKNEKVIRLFVQTILSQWNLGAGLVDQRPAGHDSQLNPICDIVGTGGDGFNTFNVSTTAAIVAAAAGVKVCKHGNRASSSASGSADLIMALGIPLDKLEPTKVAKLIQDPTLNFNFLFSPKFYPIFARLAPIRKKLGFPTIFNIIGPLLNPARPDRLLIGVTSEGLCSFVLRVLKLCRNTQSWVVCSEEGLDEISPAGTTRLWKFASDGSITHEVLKPTETFGLPSHSLDLVTGQSAQENLQMLNDLLNGCCPTEKHRAILDFVLMNTSALLVLAGKAKDFKEGVELARDSLMSGKAKAGIDLYKEKALSLA